MPRNAELTTPDQRRKRREDDDLIPWTEDLPPRIEPGPYDAVVLSAKIVNQYRRWMVEFLFRLITMGPYFDVRLKGYCNLGQIKHAKVSPHSKLASWQRAVAAFTGGSPSRVTLRSFRGFWFTVMVGTVTHDGNQKREGRA